MALPPLVSFIIPFLNSSRTLIAALESVVAQTYAGALEVSAFDDGSTDGSADVVTEWAAAPRARRVPVILSSGAAAGATGPRGPGWARNRAVAASRGEYLCFLDADDEALPQRVELQLAAARAAPSALIGGRFIRDPPDATPRYAQWANAMTPCELETHAWRECTLLQPTWFMARAQFEALGGYDEAPPLFHGGSAVLQSGHFEASSRLGPSSGGAAGEMCEDEASASSARRRHPPLVSRPPLKLLPSGLSSPTPFATFPEDTIFFHRHLEAAAKSGTATPLVRVDAPVILYRYSPSSLSWRVPRSTLNATRALLFEERILAPRGGDGGPGLKDVAIWGAGRDGKEFFNALSPAGKERITHFLDVDPRKVGNFYPVPISDKKLKRRRAEDGASPPTADAPPRCVSLPIHHFSSVGSTTRAMIICVALDTGGEELRSNVGAAVAAIRAAGGPSLVEGESLFYMC